MRMRIQKNFRDTFYNVFEHDFPPISAIFADTRNFLRESVIFPSVTEWKSGNTPVIPWEGDVYRKPRSGLNNRIMGCMRTLGPCI